MTSNTGAVLNGLFALADGVSEEEFFPAFEAFYQHLKEKGFVCRYRMMRRKPLEGFGAPLPKFDYHVEIEFRSLDEEQACYDYVKENKEPLRSLHRNMNSKVQGELARFFSESL
jgi:hypothetical protein